jgi:ABC-type antimicrobial peptide transport system permease subunit
VNGRPFTVIGVAAEGFHGLFSILDTQAFLPLGMAVMEVNVGDFMGDRANRNLYAYGRLKPGVPIQQARAEVAVIAQRLARHYPQSDEGISIQVFPERRARPEPTADQSLVTIAVLFMLLAGFVLLLACINVSNIMLVRASARQREMAIRTALGAGRVRLVRQLLTESVLLAIFGGAAGVLLGVWGASALGSMNLGTSLPIFLDFHFDWTVLCRDADGHDSGDAGRARRSGQRVTSRWTLGQRGPSRRSQRAGRGASSGFAGAADRGRALHQQSAKGRPG